MLTPYIIEVIVQRISCKGCYSISSVSAFSCGRVKMIRITTCGRVFFLKRRKKTPFLKVSGSSCRGCHGLSSGSCEN